MKVAFNFALPNKSQRGNAFIAGEALNERNLSCSKNAKTISSPLCAFQKALQLNGNGCEWSGPNGSKSAVF